MKAFGNTPLLKIMLYVYKIHRITENNNYMKNKTVKIIIVRWNLRNSNMYTFGE